MIVVLASATQFWSSRASEIFAIRHGYIKGAAPRFCASWRYECEKNVCFYCLRILFRHERCAKVSDPPRWPFDEQTAMRPHLFQPARPSRLWNVRKAAQTTLARNQRELGRVWTRLTNPALPIAALPDTFSNGGENDVKLFTHIILRFMLLYYFKFIFVYLITQQNPNVNKQTETHVQY